MVERCVRLTRRDCLDGGGQGDGEEMLRVLPGFCALEVGRGEESFNGGCGEFVTVFGVNGLAGGEVDGK